MTPNFELAIGFGIFIDGERVDTGTDFIGNPNEAQIQLTRALENQQLFRQTILYRPNTPVRHYSSCKCTLEISRSHGNDR